MDIDFESYIRGSEPDKKEKASAWKTAIGLQAVDGLQTSDYLKDTAIKHLRSIGFDVNNDLFADNSCTFAMRWFVRIIEMCEKTLNRI